ncbi:MYG1 exonuclease isoform X1 [Vespa velutina]|uniref:MYG1 exonuclease isoform X1 n=1 Tax=Vespa velutina TaxID=202808 RepID=UPI001FB2766A|nr:MYG1 exonuclease isoform X1 [Vespa velutina]
MTSQKMSQNKIITIGTHDGTFHCDEALAIFLLKLLPRYKDGIIVRSRDPDVLNSCDIVVDVGGKYDPSTHRYDHHMRDFNESLSTIIHEDGCNSKIKLSSAGLIYCHFGHEIIKQLAPVNTSDDIIKIIFNSVYYKLIQEIDAIDNGIPMFDQEPAYKILTGISSRVDRLNPSWNDENTNDNIQFLKAIDLVGEEFNYVVHNCINVWLPARYIVENAVANRFQIDESGEIIELEKFTPWQQHLMDIEKEKNIKPLIKYVIFKDIKTEYRVRAIPVKPSSFICRMFLPEKWGGLRTKELEAVNGISGSIFVHSVRFIGGHKTREGALEMARKALEIGKNEQIKLKENK